MDDALDTEQSAFSPMKNVQIVIRFDGISHIFSSVSFFQSNPFCHYMQFHLIKRQFIKWWNSICKLWYSKSQLFNEDHHWHSLKYSASTRASTEYFDAEYEYEYLCFQWSEYEYWN